MSPSRGRYRLLFRTLHAVGFAVGVALLVWVVRSALTQMNEEGWRQLASARWWQITLLLALTAATIALNGALWWLAIRPIRPRGSPSLPDMTAVNAIATTLAYAPFKLSVFFRVIYHRTIDRVPLLQIGGWGFAVGAGLAAGVGPALLASTIPPIRHSPPIWFACAIGGAFAAGFLGVRLSRFFATGAGWRGLRRLACRLAGRRGVGLLRTDAFRNAHTGLHMLTDDRVVFAAVIMRLLDTATIAARFLIAAAVLGVELSVPDAAVAGVSYFLLATFVPTGAAGVREAGTLGVFAGLGLEGSQMAPVIVLVAAVQIVGDLLCAAIATLYLGPTRLLALKRQQRREESASLDAAPA